MKTIVVMVLILALGCERPLHANDTAGSLKNAMAIFLKQSLKADSASATFDVQDVSYYEDNDFYECEFKVRMKDKSHDTTGIMQARITKDLSSVVRKW